ncbi:MAG TPA: hypothetical protein VHV51_12065 [Polyangiaceae bacterium]|jgi:hypothetical protein|nr:hypothetical protein [Polyangiaceae bacterium]
MSQFGFAHVRFAALATLAVLAQSALPACGGGANGAPATAPTAVVSAAPVAKEEPPELSAVAAPADLVAIGRFKNPESAIETVASWANFPFKIQSVIPSDLKGLEQVVAWNAPVELAVALDPMGEGKVPEPLTVVSVGLTSVDGALAFARAQGQSVHRLRSGVYRVGESDDISCAIAVAVGAAPARLVCGHRAHDVDGLINYATRGLSNEPLPDLDFQLEVRLDPIKKKYGAELGSARLLGGFLLREVQLDNPRFDRALSDVTYGLIDESLAFIHDLDKVRLDANIDRAKNLVNVRFDAKFTSQQSWLVQAAAEMVPLSAPPPPEFWLLPADSAAASYSIGWKPGRLKPLGRTLGELLDAFLDAEKVPATLRAQSEKALEGLFDLSTNAVRADGGLSLTNAPSDPLLLAADRFFGWQVAELSSDPKPVLSVFDGLTAALGSRDLLRILKQRADLDEKLWPKLSTHAVTVHGYKPGAKAYHAEFPRALLEKLSSGSSASMQDFAAALAQPAPKGKPSAKSVGVSIIVASDGTHTFVGMSSEEQALIKRLESLKDPKSPTLQTRSGLEALRGMPHASAGFLTLRRFGSAFGAARADAASMLDALPQHGDTPIIVTTDASSNGPTTSIALSVPRAAVSDLGALVPALAMVAVQGGGVLSSPAATVH